MRHTPLVRAGLAVAAAAFTSSLASAQVSTSGRNAPSTPATSSFDFTPYAGYMVFGDLMSGPLGTSLGNAPAPIIGVQVGMRIAPNVSVIGNVAGANSEITAGIPILGGVTVAETSMILYDIGLELRGTQTSASGYRFIPFAQAGVGGMHYDIKQSFMSTTSKNLAANAGVGADIALGTGMSLRLLARDYIGKFDFQDATTLNVSGNTTNNYAVSAGVRFSF